MKVKELIEKLQGLDPELMVVRPGYEGGLTEIQYTTLSTVALNFNTEWYYGEHEEIGDAEKYVGYQQAQVAEVG
jgi:hypothetical protein